MKIGIVCYPTLGGSGIVATELGHELALRGNEVHFITYEEPFRLRLENPNIFFHQVEIYQNDLYFRYPDYALTLAVKMAEIAKQYKLDILHVHYAIPHASSAFLAKQILGTKKPYVVTTLHGTDISLIGLDPAYFEIVKFSIKQSDGVTAVSKNLKKLTHESFGIKTPIQVIYNFFSPDPYFKRKESIYKTLARKGEKILLHSSNFRAVKRVPDVVKIFYEVRKKVPSKLVLIGTGPSMEEVRKMVIQYHLEDEVIFIGKSRQIDAYVASADLFLLPSELESFGLSALEAMGYGVPVVASNVGGLPEVVQHGKSGFLAPVGDIKAMSKYAIKLLQDEKLYSKVSAEAQKTAHQKFCTDKIVPQYEAFYKKVMKS